MGNGMNDNIYELLDFFYRKIGSSLGNSVYAFKGGYILGKCIGREYRSTMDLDMSVSNSGVFDYIKQILTPELEKMKAEGKIHSYKFKEPEVKGTKNVSGGVKIFRMGEFNGIPRKYKYTDIDISIHNLQGGIIVNDDGFSQYTTERSLSDKVAVLYSNKDTLLRRIRDIYDIYCMVQVTKGEIDIDSCLSFCEERNINLYQRSVFESFLSVDSDMMIGVLESFIRDGERVGMTISSGIGVVDVLDSVSWLLAKLRKG